MDTRPRLLSMKFYFDKQEYHLEYIQVLFVSFVGL